MRRKKKMKKNEKKGIIISLLAILVGTLGLLHAYLTNKSIKADYSMYSLGLSYIVIGIIFVIYYIRLSKNKKKSDEQEILYQDERNKDNRNKACAVTFKIILWISLLTDYLVTFFFNQYSELSRNLSSFTIFTIVIYSITYIMVSKRN
jgi:polyferredoxin